MKAVVTGRDAGLAAAALRATERPPWAARIFFGELDQPRRRHPLLDTGVSLRVRAGPGRRDTAVVLRPLRRQGLPDRWFAMTASASHSMTVTVDWTVQADVLPTDHVDVLTLTHDLDRLGADPGDVMWSVLQRNLVMDYCPMPVPFDRLVLRGPVMASGWTSVLDGLPVAVQRWTWPGHETLEIAIRTEPRDALLIAHLLRAALRVPGRRAEMLPCSTTKLVLDSL
ncbi:hypothetical protein BJF90_35060 [Pseudonocardia sp. CNS-004]|nr:hypothetical protein BJF90_35060 [Pseudonocardia sp. CNS-004]